MGAIVPRKKEEEEDREEEKQNKREVWKGEQEKGKEKKTCSIWLWKAGKVKTMAQSDGGHCAAPSHGRRWKRKRE